MKALAHYTLGIALLNLFFVEVSQAALLPDPGTVDRTDGSRPTQIFPTGTIGQQLNNIWGDLADFLYMLFGVLAVLSLVLAGIRYISAGSDTKKTDAAKQTILHTTLAIVLLTISYVLIGFILSFAKTIAEKV